MSGNPAEPSVADELLVGALPEDVHEALRRLSAAGALAGVLNAEPPEEDGPCDACPFHSPFDEGEYDEDDMVRAYRLGWEHAGAVGPFTVSAMIARIKLRRAGVL